MSSVGTVLPNYGIDADRVLGHESVLTALRRRFDGRYAVDEFGGDPSLMDALAPIPSALLRVEVQHPERLPRRGPALLVANRGFGIFEPFVLTLAVRRAIERRLRIVGAPNLPAIGPAANKLGAIGSRPADVAALLRAGHLAGAPLGMTWLRAGAGEPPRRLVAATLGFPVIPIAIRPGGPLNLQLRPWKVRVGEAVLPPPGTERHDHLAAAELSEQVRDAVRALLEETR